MISEPVAEPRHGRNLEGLENYGTRERILRAAAVLVAEKGFVGTSLSDIEELVQIKRGALYYHIGTKQQLLYDLIKVFLDEVLDAELAAAASGGPAERLHTLISTHVQVVSRFPNEVAILSRDFGHLTDDCAESLIVSRDRIDRLWRDLLRDGTAAGVFSTDDPVVVNAMLASVNDLWRWYDPNGRMSPEQLGALYGDLWVKALTP